MFTRSQETIAESDEDSEDDDDEVEEVDGQAQVGTEVESKKTSALTRTGTMQSQHRSSTSIAATVCSLQYLRRCSL